MKTLILALATVMLLSTNAFATDGPDACSTRMLAGRWMFATDVGKQTFFPGGDITAIGTFRVDRAGNLKGVFDATVAYLKFLPGVEFWGAVTVNPDCTGTLSFTTKAGTTRTDSIIVLGGGHVRGMSQDISFLWTYDMRRLRRIWNRRRANGRAAYFRYATISATCWAVSPNWSALSMSDRPRRLRSLTCAAGISCVIPPVLCTMSGLPPLSTMP